MIIKANQDLFQKWIALSVDMKALASIVQNDLDVPPEAISGWERSALESVERLKQLVEDTRQHAAPRTPANTTPTTRPCDGYLFDEH